MIVYNLYYKGKKAKDFADEMIKSGLVDKIRAEKGNIKYDYFIPYGKDDEILLIDAWVNQEALDNHHNSKLMEEITKLREKYDLHMLAERYIEDEMQKKDKGFIRT